MNRSFIFIILLFVSLSVFAQQNTGVWVIGRIPDASDNRLYQIQVGSFKVVRNAEGAFKMLTDASLKPSYEKYQDFTRVIIKGIRAVDMPLYIERVRLAGFLEVYIKIDSGVTSS
jgi:hypothetical protein